MSQLGGPGADIPEMSPSKYSWHGLVVKSILVAAPLRRSLTSSCSLEPVYGAVRRRRDQLQLHLARRFGVQIGEAFMAQQPTLWDQVDRNDDREPLREKGHKEKARRQT